MTFIGTSSMVISTHTGSMEHVGVALSGAAVPQCPLAAKKTTHSMSSLSSSSGLKWDPCWTPGPGSQQ